MLVVSEKFKNVMKQPIKELQAYLSSGDINLTDADELISFKISCDSGMCKTAMRKLEVAYIGETDLLGQWVHVGYGVRVDNGTFEYLDYGSFLVTEINTAKDTGVTQIIGYDKMINSMKEYQTLDITYPIDLYTFTKKICVTCNLELGNLNFDTNNDWMIETELFDNINGITYRDILVQIAQATASTCIISNDDKVYFKKLIDTEETLTYDNMKKLSLKPMYGEINSVVLARTPQEDNVYKQDDKSILENGLTEFKIENNDIVEKDRYTAINPIYDSLHGISYYPFETSTEGLGWYEIADGIKIINDMGKEFKTYLFNFSITIDGGIKEILKTSAETKTQTQYQYASSVAKRMTKTELIVDKQNQTITSITSEVSEQNEKIAKTEQTVDKLSQLVSDLENVTSKENGINFVTTKNAVAGYLLSLSIKGNMTMLFPPFLVNDTAYVKDRNLIIENELSIQKIKLPINYLNYMNATVYDEFIIDSEGTRIIRRVGMNEDGSKYQLYTPIIEKYEMIELNLLEGTNKIYLESFQNSNLIFDINYAIKNAFTDAFTTKVEMNAKFELENENINLELLKKVDNDEVIAAINMSTEKDNDGSFIGIKADKIKLEGLVTANENFKVNLDGSISTKNVYLPDGGQVIGGNGLLSNLQFVSEENIVGYLFNPVYERFEKSKAIIYCYIPNNFTIESAYVTLIHTPVKWNDLDSNGTSCYGYCRNLFAYFSEGLNIQIDAAAIGYYHKYENTYFSKINNSFGENGFTAKKASSSSRVSEIVLSEDISSSLRIGQNLISIETSNNLPTTMLGAYEQTADVVVVLNVIGYMRKENEHE